MSRFKDIVIDSREILPNLKAFADPDSVKETPKGKAIHYTFTKNGLPALLIVHIKNGGKVTLQVSGGQNPSVSEQAADALLLKATPPLVDNAAITVERWSKENFDELVDYLVESCCATKSEPQLNPSAHSTQIKVTGSQGDVVSITYYDSTSKMLVQGSPVLLIREAVSFIGSYSSVNNELYLDYLNKIFGTTTTLTAVEALIQRECPNACEFACQIFKKILISSYQILECNINFTDPNVFLFDAMRAIEFFIKELFLRNGIRINNTDGFSGKFNGNSTRTKFQLKDPFACLKTNMAIEECYGYYKTHRHEGFHANEIPAMTQILSISEAKSKAKKSLELIEKHCTVLKK